MKYLRLRIGDSTPIALSSRTSQFSYQSSQRRIKLRGVESAFLCCAEKWRAFIFHSLSSQSVHRLSHLVAAGRRGAPKAVDLQARVVKPPFVARRKGERFRLGRSMPPLSLTHSRVSIKKTLPDTHGLALAQHSQAHHRSSVMGCLGPDSITKSSQKSYEFSVKSHKSQYHIFRFLSQGDSHNICFLLNQ